MLGEVGTSNLGSLAIGGRYNGDDIWDIIKYTKLCRFMRIVKDIVAVNGKC